MPGRGLRPARGLVLGPQAIWNSARAADRASHACWGNRTARFAGGKVRAAVAGLGLVLRWLQLSLAYEHSLVKAERSKQAQRRCVFHGERLY